MNKSKLIPFIRHNLHILFVGLNPAKESSDNGHYFSVRSNFWDQLYEAGLISEKVGKDEADDIVFGSDDINFRGWTYGITDLMTDIAESDSGEVEPNVSHCERLMKEIKKFEPNVVILFHNKLQRIFLPYLGETYISANIGQIGKIMDNCPTMFFSIAFPHGNNISTKAKVEKYRAVKAYLLELE